MTQEKTAGYWIYRPWFTTKDGRKIYAKNYGTKAFRIWVEGPKREDQEDKASWAKEKRGSGNYLSFLSQPIIRGLHYTLTILSHLMVFL